MKTYYKQLFSFNRRQQRGIAVLLLLLLIAMTFDWWWPVEKKMPANQKSTEQAFLNDVRAFLEKVDDSIQTNSVEHNFFNDQATKNASVFEPFPFNPNELDDAGWKRLGLTDRQIKSIRNYQAKGGKFFKKEDLARLYALKPDDYSRIEPYIRIPDTRKQFDTLQTAKWAASKSERNQIVELNGADSTLLTSLQGIGPAFARRILKYRQRLGGFVKSEQLLEVYGMDSARYQLIRNRVVVDTSLVVKININKASFKEILRHPYFEYYIVKAICNEREKRHGFDQKTDLLSVKLIYHELYLKIEPYICTSDLSR